MAHDLRIPSSIKGLLRETLRGSPLQIGDAANAEVVSWYPKDWIAKYDVTYSSYSSWADADERFESVTFPDMDCYFQIDACRIWKTNFTAIKASGFVFSELTQDHSWSFSSLDFQIGVSGDYTIHATAPGYPDELEIDLAYWGV